MQDGDNYIRLNQVAEIRTGVTFKNAIQPDPKGDLYVILPRDISDGSLSTPPTSIDSRQVKSSSYHLLSSGEILLTNKGTRFGTFLYQGVPERTIATSSFFVITPNRRSLLPGFLYWFLNQPPAKEYFTKNAFGSTIRSINKGVVANLQLPIPPIHTQEHLLKFILETENEQQLLETLLQKKKAFSNSYIWEHINIKN
jgi:restriction endonuclease S subunit